MKNKIIEKKSLKRLAISEIFLLVISIVAFSFIVESSFSVVSADDTGDSTEYITTETPSVTPAPASGSWVGAALAAVGGVGAWAGGSAIIKGGISPSFVGPLQPTTKYLAKVLERLSFSGGAWEGVAGPLIAAGVAVAAVAIYMFISTLIKTGDAGKAAEAALRVGVSAATGALAGYVTVALVGGPAGWIVGGLAVLGAIFSSWLKREQDRQITFTCKPWQAQSGGDDCELCNKGDFPCTEYQCKSLGTACEIINKNTDNPRCIWKNPNDVNPPQITAWKDALTKGYKYVSLGGGGYGVEIRKIGAEECLPFFQPFSFGVELDKEGYCRIDYERTSDFSKMKYDFGGSNLYKIHHTQDMSFPGVIHLEDAGINLTELNIGTSGEYEFYVRCEAATNGKSNRNEFVFKFCIDSGPDITPPLIMNFSLPDNSPIAYFEEGETRETNILAYVNEPAECKWSHEDKSYEEMENSMMCSDELINFNAQLSYTCSGKLTGLENGQKNEFFFRCNDTFGNVNVQSRKLTLMGTQPLVISSAEPNKTTIRDSTDSIKVTFEVETSAGYRDGESTCYLSDTGTGGNYLLFSNTTTSSYHKTNLWLGPGQYDYFIRCIDLAGNSDNKQISFTVETDTSPPAVVRIFRDGSNLKIVTDEEATCVYDNKNCLYNFEDGVKMTDDEKIHSVNWDSNKNFYIKCQDEFGNKPLPQSCSIIVKPFEI